MRFFEILLLVLSFTCLFQQVILNKQVKTRRFLVFLSIGILLLHFLIEGGRWQMTLVYILLTILGLSHFLGFAVTKKNYKRILIGIAFLTTVITGFLAYVLPVFKLPYQFHEYHPATISGQTNEKVNFKLWIPAEEIKSNAKLSKYHSNPSIALKNVMGMPGFVFSHLEKVKTNAVHLNDAILGKQKFPLILYSHGASSTYVDNTALMEEITSAGYAVVAVDHNFSFDRYKISESKARQIDVDIQKALIDTLINKVVPSQTQDYNSIILYLKGNFSDNIDFSNIAIIGHSLGGSTACDGAEILQNTKAIVNMDGPISSNFSNTYKGPFLYMSSFSPDQDEKTLKKYRVPPKFYKEVKNHELQNVKSLFQNKQENQYWVRVKTANHLDYSDLPFIIPIMSSPFYEKNQGHRLKSQIIIEFLNNSLLNMGKDIRTNDEILEWIYPKIN